MLTHLKVVFVFKRSFFPVILIGTCRSVAFLDGDQITSANTELILWVVVKVEGDLVIYGEHFFEFFTFPRLYIAW